MNSMNSWRPRTPVASFARPANTRLGLFALTAMVFCFAGTTASVATTGKTDSSELESISPDAGEKAWVDPTKDEAALNHFLDRLMRVESGGIDTAKNPRSTALGPFQFIESTFLELVKREFAEETAGLGRQAILKLRTNRDFSRRVATVYVRDSAETLLAGGVPANFGNLRLAYLLGSSAALEVLKADPKKPAVSIVGKAVVRANPFMSRMTAERLAQWSEKNIGGHNFAAATPSAPEEKSDDGQSEEQVAQAEVETPVKANKIVIDSSKKKIASAPRPKKSATAAKKKRKVASARAKKKVATAARKKKVTTAARKKTKPTRTATKAERAAGKKAAGKADARKKKNQTVENEEAAKSRSAS